MTRSLIGFGVLVVGGTAIASIVGGTLWPLLCGLAALIILFGFLAALTSK